MPVLLIRLTRKSDGTNVISCEREDGTTTWQRRRSDFFPFHDLTHYAVETQLTMRSCFYGLLLDGWQHSDFGDNKLPTESSNEAIVVESIVGLLDQETGTGERQEAKEFNSELNRALEGLDCPMRRELSVDVLAAIRETRLELFGRWSNTESRESVDLEFRET